MTITAKHPGQCAACGGAISAGESIEWEKGKKARHAKCPAAGTVLNAAYQPKGETARTNRVGERCTCCGVQLAPGRGNRWWGEDGCCSNPRHFDAGGWHVTCQDRDACEARVRERAAARKAAEQEAEAKRAAERAEAAKARAAYEAVKAAIPADYIHSMSVRLPEITSLEQIAAYDCSVLRRGRIDDAVVYIEDWSGFDDYRTYLIAPPAVMLPLLDAIIRERGITRPKAEEWLSRYGGCVGAEVYRRAMETL